MLGRDGANLIRIGILALPLSGQLVLMGPLGNFGAPDPSGDPMAAARTLSSAGYS